MSNAAAGLDAFLRQVVERGLVPGVSVAVSSPHFSHQAAFGLASVDGGIPMDPATRFSLGCIGKVFTGLIALRFAEAGRIEPDAPLEHYLPELVRGAAASGIRVRHLASHTSGFEGLSLADPRVSHLYDWEKFVGFFRTTPRTFTPGTVFNYDHSEHVMLGEVLKRTSGRNWQELFDDYVFGGEGNCAALGASPSAAAPTARAADHVADARPGGFRQLAFMPHGKFWEFSLPPIAMSPAGLLRVFQKLVMSQERDVFHDAIRLPAMSGPAQHEKTPLAFGACCARYGPTLFGHNGSARGQTCGVRFDPQAGLGVVVAMNAWQPHLRDHILERIVQFLRGTGAAETPLARPVPPDHPRFAPDGRYSGGVVGTEIRVRDAQESWQVEMCSRHAPAPVRFGLALDERGDLKVGDEAGHLSVGFFRDPIDESPCMMVGLNAFKQRRAAEAS